MGIFLMYIKKPCRYEANIYMYMNRYISQKKLFCLLTYFPEIWYLYVTLASETFYSCDFFSIQALVFETIDNSQFLLVIFYKFQNNRSHQPNILEQKQRQFQNPFSIPNKTKNAIFSILYFFSFDLQFSIINSKIANLTCLKRQKNLNRK